MSQAQTLYQVLIEIEFIDRTLCPETLLDFVQEEFKDAVIGIGTIGAMTVEYPGIGTEKELKKTIREKIDRVENEGCPRGIRSIFITLDKH